jgi:septal ring-binding cell division protein DamX
MSRRILSVALAFQLIAVGSAAGQRASGTAADSAFARARRLVQSGNGTAGRLLVDSVVATTAPDTPAYAEALYWRATLAASTTDAEHDYRRIVVEYPLSPRSGDALLRLANIESDRGERTLAAAHLQRFLLENADRPERGRAGVQLTRLLFDANDVPHACAALADAQADVPKDDVEMRNQLDYFAPRCEAWRASVAAADSVRRDSVRADSARVVRDSIAHAAAKRARYTVQLAAYATRDAATALVTKLAARGIEARITGTKKPFRVRTGFYATHSEAANAVKALKAKGISGIVADMSDER